MLDGNTEALNRHMAAQDRADEVMRLYGEEARQILSDRIWNEEFDSIEDDLRGLLEDLDEGLADLLLGAAHDRQTDLTGCFACAAVTLDMRSSGDLRAYLEEIAPTATRALYSAARTGEVTGAGNCFLQILDAKCDSLIDRDELADKAHELARGE